MKISKTTPVIEVKIEKLVHGGQGISHYGNKPVFIWGALPGETVNLCITKENSKIIEGIIDGLPTISSSHRIEPQEKHFLSCSPWQTMSYDEELRQKKAIATETFLRIGGLEIGNCLPAEALAKAGELPARRSLGAGGGIGEVIYGYRNKMEYSFSRDQDRISFGFFGRGTRRVQSINECLLALPELNNTAHYILDWIIENDLPFEILKSLIIRTNLKGQSIAGLFITEKNITFENLPQLNDKLLGFNIYYSDRRTPASVIHQVLNSYGEQSINENINGVDLEYGLMSFFQINPPIFEQTLKDIERYIEKDENILDYYSGVGSISIPLSNKIKGAILVDINSEAIDYAKKNIEKLGLKNFQAFSSPAEKMLEHIDSKTTLIIDPPREGMHPKVLNKIMEVLPLKIIYLSCNISTQARDLKTLLENYKVIGNKLYNYFPRTPHIESLLILERV